MDQPEIIYQGNSVGGLQDTNHDRVRLSDNPGSLEEEEMQLQWALAISATEAETEEEKRKVNDAEFELGLSQSMLESNAFQSQSSQAVTILPLSYQGEARLHLIPFQSTSTLPENQAQNETSLPTDVLPPSPLLDQAEGATQVHSQTYPSPSTSSQGQALGTTQYDGGLLNPAGGDASLNDMEKARPKSVIEEEEQLQYILRLSEWEAEQEEMKKRTEAASLQLAMLKSKHELRTMQPASMSPQFPPPLPFVAFTSGSSTAIQGVSLVQLLQSPPLSSPSFNPSYTPLPDSSGLLTIGLAQQPKRPRRGRSQTVASCPPLLAGPSSSTVYVDGFATYANPPEQSQPPPTPLPDSAGLQTIGLAEQPKRPRRGRSQTVASCPPLLAGPSSSTVYVDGFAAYANPPEQSQPPPTPTYPSGTSTSFAGLQTIGLAQQPKRPRRGRSQTVASCPPLLAGPSSSTVYVDGFATYANPPEPSQSPPTPIYPSGPSTSFAVAAAPFNSTSHGQHEGAGESFRKRKFETTGLSTSSSVEEIDLTDDNSPSSSTEPVASTSQENASAKKGSFLMLPTAPNSHKFLSIGKSARTPKFMVAVNKELKWLRDSLPPGIWVKSYEDRMDLYSAMILGPADTPYEDGLFFFDIQLPGNYPQKPPLVHYYSYCRGRLNPNLYDEGKVCLSLLGTWNGSGNENWTKKSTLLQVLVSIQGLILVDEPYYNEPGYANGRNNKSHQNASRFYTEDTVLKVVQSMTAMCRNPHPIFVDEIKEHLSHNGDRLIARNEKWFTNENVGPDNGPSMATMLMLQSFSLLSPYPALFNKQYVGPPKGRTKKAQPKLAPALPVAPPSNAKGKPAYPLLPLSRNAVSAMQKALPALRQEINKFLRR